MREFQTACGGTMVVPPKAEEHLRAHPEVQALLGDAIARVILPTAGEFLAVAVDLRRIVGRSGCVQTPRIGLNDPATFALRSARARMSRVVVAAVGPETSRVAVLGFPSREDRRTYVLVTTFVGPLAPKEPWDQFVRTEAERRESLDFWCTNALVYDSAVMGPVVTSSWAAIVR